MIFQEGVLAAWAISHWEILLFVGFMVIAWGALVWAVLHEGRGDAPEQDSQDE